MDKKFSPREFMEGRRPEKFSDSVLVRPAKLNRLILENQLDTLTNRNQERSFETFCVKLAQLEICPNLRVQTGPVGGGDSKADSETYPVSDFTQLTYYTGIPNETSDKWAFAISAKKDWVAKVKSDIAAVASTARGYQKIYFITSQYAPDKKRSGLEDTLGPQYGMQLVILDRNWILDRIFTNSRQIMAIEELGLGEGLEPEVSTGLLDIERLRKFKALNTEIETAVSKKEVGFHTIKNALNTALLARGMERSQDEVYGLFHRALRIAVQYGSEDQQFNVKYNFAWTAYFWFEDFAQFISLYNEVEELAKESTNIYTAERLNNLWQVMLVLHKSGYPMNASYFPAKTTNNRNVLTRFAGDENRPSSAAYAGTMLLMGNLLESPDDAVILENCFKRLAVILKDAEKLIGFPFDSVFETIEEIGDAFGNLSAYEKLVEDTINLNSKRKGEVPAGESFSKMGVRHLDAGRVYKAIDYLGRSLKSLYKDESRKAFVFSLYALGIAYERAGLLWAARGALINAASFATDDFWKYQDINSMQAKCYHRLKWVELRLGRAAQSMEWQELDMVISNGLAKTDEEREMAFRDTFYDYGMGLGCLLIKTPENKFAEIESLPDTLYRMDLDFAAFPLLFLLDGGKYLPEEFKERDDLQTLNELFSKWLDQPIQNALAAAPLFYEEEKVNLTSRILGLEIIVKCGKHAPELEIGESLMACLESFLATGTQWHAAPRMPLITITLKETPANSRILEFKPNMDINGNIELEYMQFSPHKLSKEQNEALGDAMMNLIGYITANAIIFPDGIDNLKKLLVDESIFDRSFSFVGSMVTLGNVLGHDYKRSISDWIGADNKRYSYVPDTARRLRKAEVRPDDREKTTVEDFTSHADYQFFTVINEQLWEKAKWRGVCYQGDRSPVPSQPPFLLLMFENEESGKEIFRQWKAQYGDDAASHIRIGIVKGIDEGHPYWYRAMVGPYTQKMPKKKHFIVQTKLCTMNAESHANLNLFLDTFAKTKFFWFAPAYGVPGMTQPKPSLELGFLCRDIVIRNAWEIGVNDLDLVAVSANAEPVIPPDVKNAPVLELIKKRKERNQQNPL